MLEAQYAESDRYIGRRFQYEAVAQDLRSRIQSGLFAPGEKIATHNALARQYDVSAITVRRAINELVREGLLVGRQGIGVFVTNRRRIVRTLGFASTVPFSEEIHRAGFEPGIRELSNSMIVAPAKVASQLKVPSGSYVVRYEKLILADGEPISREVTFLPPSIGEELQAEISRSFIFSLFAQHGYEVDHVDFCVEGTAATEIEVRQFNVSTGFSLLSVDYLYVCVGDRPVATGTIVSRSDRLSFDLSANWKSYQTRQKK